MLSYSSRAMRCIQCFDAFSAQYTNTLNPNHDVIVLDPHCDELSCACWRKRGHQEIHLPCALHSCGLAFFLATVTQMEVSCSATALDAVGLGHGTCRDI